MNKDQILKLLKTVSYPGFTRDIVSFGIVEHIQVDKKNVTIPISNGDAKSKLKGATTDSTKGKFQIFISGSGIPANTDLPQNYGRLLGNLELPSDESNGQGSYNFELVEAGYFSRIETNAFIQVRMPSGRWKLAEISVKPSTSTNFSPEVFKCYAELPVAQKRPDFYQFLTYSDPGPVHYYK